MHCEYTTSTFLHILQSDISRKGFYIISSVKKVNYFYLYVSLVTNGTRGTEEYSEVQCPLKDFNALGHFLHRQGAWVRNFTVIRELLL